MKLHCRDPAGVGVNSRGQRPRNEHRNLSDPEKVEQNLDPYRGPDAFVANIPWALPTAINLHAFSIPIVLNLRAWGVVHTRIQSTKTSILAPSPLRQSIC